MCDTLVALSNSTKDGSVIFAKNSDRDPNEAHELILVPRTRHAPGSQVRCTYVEIPQVTETNAVLLAKPFWIWGAEMGANEHGVVIGNEAVFTKIPAQKEPGLIGMDFLRLALERAATAREALTVITQLLEKYGQGGNCGFALKIYYHNSFMIADPEEAWVLETADRHWAAEQVKGIRTISNRITIGNEWDLASEGLVEYAIERGWCKSRDDFDFGRCYSDFIYTRFSDSYARFCRTTDILSRDKGKIGVETMMSALRDHGPDHTTDFSPGRGLSGADVCEHASFGPIRISQSVGSMVAHLTPDLHTHWFTGTSAPCTSLFKPVWMDSSLPDMGPAPQGKYDDQSLWWQHEVLHRSVLQDYQTRLNQYKGERDQLEMEFLDKARQLNGASLEERRSFSEQCFKSASQATRSWTERVRNIPVKAGQPLLHNMAWRGANQQADYPF
ncbi:MAG TPA: C69 family dipeptidase [Anaerolineales bacterium]|nr:C69 family dipeptidase [Anaerolineales bacterium]